MKKAIFAIGLLLTILTVGGLVPALAQDGVAAGLPRRVALVVGNGAYAANPLKNPPNDATDVEAALKDAGFEVSLLVDADLTRFERAVTDFTGRLKGADTGLFYYAGHGVAVDGLNYLIPVSPSLDAAADVKAKAVSVDSVLGRMEGSGVRTALVFLDSCRDNPFPGSTRSGTRGLAVVQTPRTVNSLIAYATSPGDVALDGSGRNGVFSGAFLSQLAKPGQELGELMRNVKSEVAELTGGRQQPRVDDGMKEAFYFISPELLAARAQAALDANKAELASLERELADRQALIASSKDALARQALEVEQQRQQALATAKRLEAENLAREAERQRALAIEASAQAAQRAAAAAAQAKQQAELTDLAAARRAELEQLATAAASDNPDILIETVERLEAVLKEVDDQYAAALAASLKASDDSWSRQLVSLSAQKPDITETDAEFNARIAKEKATLEASQQAELARLRKDAETRRLDQTASMRQQYDDTLRTLETRLWTISGKGATLAVGEFDRNTRLWPFSAGSADPALPMLPMQVVADLNQAADVREAILALDTAVKAGALAAEIDWGIRKDRANKRYALDVRAVRVINLGNGQAVAQSNIQQRVGYFSAGKRSTPTPAFGTLVVGGTAKDGPADVYIDGTKVGLLPYTGRLAEGDHTITVQWPEEMAMPFTKAFSITPGQALSIKVADKLVIKVGGKGPAGGIVFYDKGSYSDSWRFLEAAPTDTHANIQWYNGKNVDIKTGTAVGSGKANTAAIIEAQGPGSYAAALCDSLVLGGYDDWFLPSKDELDLIYRNLKKAGLGGFGGGWFWSSSQCYDYFAWVQSFSDGFQYYYSKYSKYAVRAVRAF